MASDSVVISVAFQQLDKNLKSVVKNAMTDITTDFLRTAQARTPVDSRTLERSGTMKMKNSGDIIEGQVSFRARKKGYNYAVIRDEGKYNLGEKSKQKSGRGVRSQFSKESLPVGSGYASDTLAKCRDQYDDYIKEKLNEEIRKLGFK